MATIVVIEVWDSDPAAPVPQPVTGEDEGGRGLVIVAMLSAQWSWFPAPQGGKVVWAELPIPPCPLAGAGLPQQSRPDAVTGPAQGNALVTATMEAARDAALADLDVRYGEAYDLAVTRAGWVAKRLDDSCALVADSPEELRQKIEVDAGAGLPRRSRAVAVTGGNRGGVIRDRELLRRIHQGLKNL